MEAGGPGPSSRVSRGPEQGALSERMVCVLSMMVHCLQYRD